MWKAVADLQGQKTTLATAGRYETVLEKTRQWLSEQGEVWFDMRGLRPPHMMPSHEMEELGIEFIEDEDEE